MVDPKQICLITESPFRILKVAASGNIVEFERLFCDDKTRLFIKDNKGHGVAHHAASKGRLSILAFIFANQGDLDARDNTRCTPLHVAVENKQTGAIGFLLSHGADHTMRNANEEMPLHYSVSMKHHDVLKYLVEHPAVDKEARGPNGATALHMAAYNDDLEAATILVNAGASLNKKCDLGLFPIHVATTQAATKVLQFLLQEGERRGSKGEDLLNYQDGDNKNPLHSAVNAGNIMAVRLCLENGGSIDAQQDDQSTAVHLACAQGNIDIVKAMFEKQSETARLVVHMTDIQEMTPLHKAAMFDRAEIAELLLAWGADVEARDKQQQTPLLLATSKGAWHTARFLVSRGAQAFCRDDMMRNIFHLCILSGGAPVDIGCSTMKEECKKLLNEQDVTGCTPLHYASKGGQLQAIEALILHGADIGPKNRKRRSPLHFAAKYGRFNTCKRLLNSVAIQGILNDADNKGLTPLHLASKCGHYRVVQLLLHKGAVIFRDLDGNTPLHLAARSGFVKTVELILSVHAYLLNSENRTKDTALHIAAAAGHNMVVSALLDRGSELALNDRKQTFLDCAIEAKNKDVCLAVITSHRWEDAMSLGSEQFGSPLLGMVTQLPDCVTAVLDRCQSSSVHDRCSPHYWEKYDFRLLIEDSPDGSPMFPLEMMVRYGRTECLSHPVCEHLLRAKWLRYGLPLYVLNMALYIAFVSVLTTIIVTREPSQSSDILTTNCTTSDQYIPGCPGHGKTMPVQPLPCAILLGCFCVLSMVKEVLQMVQQRVKYLLDMNNYLEWVLYLATAVFVGSYLRTGEFEWQAGSIAIFLAWFNLFLYLQRFGVFGIYVVMFLEILHTLVNVIVVFALLIVAFGLTFFVLMGEVVHGSVGLSVLRTCVMMLGEIDFLQTFVQPLMDNRPETMQYETLSAIFLVVFVVLVPILLMNLLIGLAVGDIEAVQRNAVLKRLAMQVDMHTDLEKKLPRRLQKWLRIEEVIVHPNCRNFCMKNKLSQITAIGAHQDGQCDGEAFDPIGQRVFLQQELFKQKRRLKSVSTALDRQYALLRLVVQKMEIHSEADELDETSTRTTDVLPPAMRGWNRPALRGMLFRREVPSILNAL